MKLDLTICSVVFYSEIYLNTNLKFTDLSNVVYEWIAVDNTKFGKAERLDHTKLDKAFTIIDGIDRNIYEKKDKLGPNNFVHGNCLNKAISVAKPSRYLLLLDPDFYIIPPISKILGYMQEKGIAIFGSPYMSKTPLIWNFPVAFNLFIDLEKIGPDTLDFEPGYKGYKDKVIHPDVGYSFTRFHQKAGTKFEATIPSVKEPENPPYNFTRKSLDSYKIKYKNPVNEKGTKIDEYFWQNDIYGVHLRGKLDKHINFRSERIQQQMNTIRYIFDQIRSRNLIS